MSAKVYNHETAQWVEVPDSDVQDKILSGDYTFESGITIPVVAPDGQLGSIPAENAHDAFKDGFRWATQVDKDADHAAKSEAIKAEHFNTPTTALGMGVLRGATLGGSDALIRVGEELGALPSGVTEAASEVQARSPTASTVGSVIGAVASPVGRMGRALAGTTVGKLGSTAANLTKAQKALAVTGETAAGSALEGAMYGAGQAVTESSLGDPTKAVDNLVYNLGLGALTGGVFGAGMGGASIAKPYLQTLADKGLSRADKAFRDITRKGIAKTGKALVNVAHGNGLGNVFEKAALDDVGRALVSRGSEAERAKGTRFAMDTLREASKDVSLAKGAVGTALGAIFGGPVGSVAGFAATTALTPHRTLQMLTAIERASQKGAKRMSDAFTKVTDAFTAPSARSLMAQTAIKTESMRTKKERFKQLSESIAALSTPEGLTNALAEMGGNAEGLSTLKTHAGIRLQDATMYLNSMMPKDPLAEHTIFADQSAWEPTDTEVTTFLRRARVVNDPISALDSIADGTITAEETDALKTVYPDVYETLQQNLIGAIIDRGPKIPYQRRLLLGSVFGIPTDYSMTPDFINKMQSIYAPKDKGGRPDGSQEGGASKAPSRKKNIDISPFSTVATETSRITYGDKV